MPETAGAAFGDAEIRYIGDRDECRQRDRRDDSLGDPVAMLDDEILERMHDEDRQRSSLLARFKVEWHRKIMLAFACIIFLFIGAPLGAIIRKGGMGMPTVFAILFFLVFHVISFSAEKLVISGKLEAWPGMWISSAVLLPLGAFLTWKAATDSPILDRDAYHRGWDKLRKLFAPSRHADPATM